MRIYLIQFIIAAGPKFEFIAGKMDTILSGAPCGRILRALPDTRNFYFKSIDSAFSSCEMSGANRGEIG